MNFSIVTDYNKIDKVQWAEFVENHPDGNYFQTYEFIKINEGVGKYKPFVIVAYDDELLIGLVVGVIQIEDYSLLSFMTSRAIIIGGPLVIDNNKEVLNELLYNLNKYLKNKAIYTEFRNQFDLDEFVNVFSGNGFTYKDHLNFIVNCTDMDIIKKRMSRSKVRQVKKSLKEGAIIIENPDINQVKEFYYLLLELYKQIVKKPLPPWTFFRNFYENKTGKYLLISFSSQIIGGMMCPIHINKEIYEWYICGLDREFKDIYPSVLATWAAIDYANRNNISYFNFLGAGNPDQNYGVREFKAKFGGDLINYGRFQKINRKELYLISKFGFYIYQKLK